MSTALPLQRSRTWCAALALILGIDAVHWTVAGEQLRQAPPRAPDAFYVPSSQAAADAMLELAGVTARDVVYDLGSGDGRILIVAAQKYGARGVGIEIDPALVARAQAIAREGGVDDKVRFIEGNFFEADLREATVVTLYLSTTTNRRLRSKLRAELSPGTRVVSQQFDMGPWKPDRQVRAGDAELFLWVIPGPRAYRFNVASRF